MQKLLTFFSIYALFNDQSFNDTLTNDIVSFDFYTTDLYIYIYSSSVWSSKNHCGLRINNYSSTAHFQQTNE